MKSDLRERWFRNAALSVRDWTARGKLLILAIISTSTFTACTSPDLYGSRSVRYPAHEVYGLIYNITAYNYYGLSADDKRKQQEAVFFALDNADNGEVVEWYNEQRNTYGKVKPVQSYPQGSGYCRTLFSLISVKNKQRTFTETACVEGGHQGWRFIRK